MCVNYAELSMERLKVPLEVILSYLDVVTRGLYFFFFFFISTNARMLIFIRRRDQICNFFSLSFSINHTSHLISPQCDFTTNRDSIYYSWAFAVTLVNSLLGLVQLLGLSSQFQWFEPEAQARTKSNNVIVLYYESCLYTHYWPLFNDFVYNFNQFPLYLYL